MKKKFRKVPDIVSTLLKLDEEQIELLNDTILLNLTNSQLKNIQTNSIINLPLLDKIRYVEQKNFRNNITHMERHDYWRLMNQTMNT